MKKFLTFVIFIPWKTDDESMILDGKTALKRNLMIFEGLHWGLTAQDPQQLSNLKL